MDFIYTIIKRLKIILIITFTFFFSTTLFLILQKQNYNSVSKIISSSGSTSGISQAIGLASQFGFNIPLQTGTKWVYTDIIRSRTFIRSILKHKFDSIEFGSQKPLTQILTYGNNKPNTSLEILEKIAIDRFLELVKISEDIKTGIFTLTITSSEPELANNINTVLINELEKHQRDYENAITSKTRRFIEQRIIESEKELSIAEDLLRKFRDRNRRIENSPALQLEQERLLRDVAVFTGVFTNLKQQFETAKIEEVRERDYVIILDYPEVLIANNFSKNIFIIILFTSLGIAFSLLLIYSMDYVVEKEKDIRKMLKLIRK